jgi:hypothetical protein
MLLIPQATLANVEPITLAGIHEMPRWPFYSAMIVAAIFACRHTIAYFKNRRPKAKIFPKLELRRRFYAPYSGGNFATIRFDPRRDA